MINGYFLASVLSGITFWKRLNIESTLQVLIYAIPGRPTLTKKAKASYWLVRHHLRSLNTVNEGHYMKNMSIERIT